MSDNIIESFNNIKEVSKVANVFDGLKKLKDNDIRYEISILEEINLINYAKQIGQVIEESSPKIINFLSTQNKTH